MALPPRIAHAATVLAALVFLTACGQRGVWTKEGATQSEVTAAQKDCAHDSSGYGFLNNQSASEGASPRYETDTRNSLYRLCMSSKGFGQIPESQAKQQQQQQQKQQQSQ
jgi:hypothetical protein